MNNLKIGLDSKLFSCSAFEQIQKLDFVKIEDPNFNLDPILFETSGENQNDEKIPHFLHHPAEYTGFTTSEKLNKLRETLAKSTDAESLFVTSLEQISWLLNVKALE